MKPNDLAAKRRRGPAAILAALLLAACVPQSINALGDPVAPDPRLAGEWKGMIGDGPAVLTIAARDDAKLEIVIETVDADGSANRAVMTGLPSRRDSYAYVNVKLRASGDEVYDPARENYFICRYEIAGDGSLTVWAMSEKLATKAIADGGVNGLVDPGRGGEPTIVITDSTLALADFVDAFLPERVFAERVGTFHRAN